MSLGEKTVQRTIENALKDLSTARDIKVVLIDSAGNVISDISLSAHRDALKGTGNRDFTTLETDIEAILAQLDVALSTRASETTLSSILSQLDVALSTRASETTLTSIDGKLSPLLKQLAQSLLTESALSYDNSAGTATADYTVFSTDVSVNFNGKIVIQIIMDQTTTAQLKVTPAGQTTAYTGYINEGNLQANSWYEFEFEVNNGDALNVVIQVPAGAVLSGYLRIFKRER